MKRTSTPHAILLVCVLSLAISCSEEPAAQVVHETPSPTPEATAIGGSSLAELVPYGREPWPGIITAGQPSKEAFEALRDAGVRTVVNLRVPSERGTRDEPAWLEELGLEHVSIPVNGAAGLSEEVARELDRVLAAAERPVLVHCGSSNRVGAVFALRAFHVEGKSPEEALEIGLSAGVTKLEGKVREMLAEASTPDGRSSSRSR
ncbi:MAG: hypothetical protein GY769_19640 [bacterium]|nr:hypothetical protein [bacterium]